MIFIPTWPTIRWCMFDIPKCNSISTDGLIASACEINCFWIWKQRKSRESNNHTKRLNWSSLKRHLTETLTWVNNLNQDFIVSSMGKCPFKPGSIQWLFELCIPTTLAICLHNLKEVKNCDSHVLLSGENPRGNHERRGYCRFSSIFKVICHYQLATILHFGERKNGNQFFLNPYVSKI